MKRLLITGGSGYLGEALADRASAAGWQVAATFFSRQPARAGIAWHQLDVRDADATARLFAELRPDVAIHTAYRLSGPDLWPITAQGAEHVALAASAAGTRLIHMSSDALFDGDLPPGQRYSEADDPSPITPYGEAKAAAERAVERLAPGALVVRTSLIYGGALPGQHERLVLEALAERADIAFFTDELRCPVAVGDLAAALVELAAGDRAGRLHIAGPDVQSRYSFAQAVARAYGHDPARLRGGLSAASGTRRPRNCALDSSVAYGLLRTRIRGVAEVLGLETRAG